MASAPAMGICTTSIRAAAQEKRTNARMRAIPAARRRLTSRRAATRMTLPECGQNPSGVGGSIEFWPQLQGLLESDLGLGFLAKLCVGGTETIVIRRIVRILFNRRLQRRHGEV